MAQDPVDGRNQKTLGLAAAGSTGNHRVALPFEVLDVPAQSADCLFLMPVKQPVGRQPFAPRQRCHRLLRRLGLQSKPSSGRLRPRWTSGLLCLEETSEIAMKQSRLDEMIDGGLTRYEWRSRLQKRPCQQLARL
ncbi:MAG: hypothetical protein KatS3mg105_2214 [Gemmatales bacterium]|nr:MAG: hypothetical protein KatS3mg105_2214 [Gemmatales bacterium]